ncbi:hypothetical protein EYF80_057521 [Liparis tanakae]|uniref:Uncharacterized protein n=1 Tax=Liparis tanakae TaxID=230148 RepID=A0A4Z2EU59_9TELE|nr:hypothetical protein EYF80_057521 [Liparis tanakae]
MKEPLTSLRQRGVGFVLVHQQLDLLRLQRRVQDLVEARVPLLVVDELRQLLHVEVRTTLRAPEDEETPDVNTGRRGGGGGAKQFFQTTE